MQSRTKRATRAAQRNAASRSSIGRRSLLQAAALAGGAGLLRPYLALAAGRRPRLTHGLQSGEVTQDGGVIWARADRPSRLIAEVATTASFRDARRIVGPSALAADDFTARLRLTGLPADQEIFYRLQFEDPQEAGLASEPASGHFRTAPSGRRSVSFLWSGDTAGQGWGINLDWGGMKIYEQMRRLAPDFFVHCGDTIYADGPIPAEQRLPDGSLWRNLVTEETSKVAESLAEFRGNYKYNLLDANVLRFNAEVPVIAMWNDHEVLNNWYPGEIVHARTFGERNVDVLAARARRAFLDFMPMVPDLADPARIHRRVAYGPLLDLFLLDTRSYRGRNSPGRETTPGPGTDYLGAAQLDWLRQGLLASRAAWKVIAIDMPLAIIVPDKHGAFDGLANRDGPPSGRELELATLLAFIKRNAIANVVWLTADVHYAAAHAYDPNRARFQDFTPFWEFVAGPLHAGSFGPRELDDSFGPRVVFAKAPGPERQNLPPSEGLQFFGQVEIDGATEVMTVRLRDLEGTVVYQVELEPAV